MELTNLPKELLSLKKPVKKLYFKGNLELLQKRKVAIIGSRKASIYTKNCVKELASLLRNVGVAVVSGGALGVDINAHIGSMPSTIAVFANGLNSIYPKSNEKIIKNIYENALALSENEPDYIAKNYDFLLRNRIIIALSEAVVIAEADLQSGSMQSARLCEQMQKKLFVLPQRAFESKGTNLLLANNKASLINDFHAFASSFGKLEEKEDDEFITFCKQESSVEKILNKFGDLLYEYELNGKIEIYGTSVKVLV